jgi:hypothetical protein
MESGSGKRPLSPAAEWLGRIILIAVSILIALVGLELVTRFNRGSEWLLRWPNFVLASQARFESELRGQFAFDPRLGFVSRPGFTSTEANHDAQGFRLVPEGPGVATGSPILATGDSFTYGAEIADDGSWPALLQADLGRKVLNGGVVGFGLDQIVLHTEQLAVRDKPGLLVVGFIADDLRRSEYRRLWGKEKPYFDLVEGKLALRNVPVSPDATIPLHLRFLRDVFGWSALLETIMRRVGDPYEWQAAGVRVLPRGEGAALACPLMERLASLGIPTLVVGLYAPPVWNLDPRPAWIVEEVRQTRDVLACATKAGMGALDTYETIDRAAAALGKGAIFFNFHMSAEGNRLIAAAVAEAIRAGAAKRAGR